MAKRTAIAELKHRVALCSMHDVVTEDGKMVLVRQDVAKFWVKIEPRTSSMFSQAGYSIQEPRDRQTHLITMRFRRDFDISSAAWVYEERLQSGARWFKVLGIKEQGEDGEFMTLSAKLIERGDDLTPPVAEGDQVPVLVKRVEHGVKL